MGKYLTFNQVRAQITSGDSNVFRDFLITQGNLQIQANLGVVSPLGNANRRSLVPAGPRTASLSFDYYPTGVGHDNISSATGDYTTGCAVSFCGYTGYQAYLNSYTVSIAPYQPVKASVSYSIFGEIAGQLGQTSAFVVSTDEIAHAQTSQYTNFNTSNFLLDGIQSVNYSINVTREPQYVLGGKFPQASGVLLTSVTREVAVQGRNLGQALSYTGLKQGDTVSVQLRSAISANNIGIPLSISGTIVSQQLSAEEAGIVRGSVTVREVLF